MSLQDQNLNKNSVTCLLLTRFLKDNGYNSEIIMLDDSEFGVKIIQNQLEVMIYTCYAPKIAITNNVQRKGPTILDLRSPNSLEKLETLLNILRKDKCS